MLTRRTFLKASFSAAALIVAGSAGELLADSVSDSICFPYVKNGKIQQTPEGEDLIQGFSVIMFGDKKKKETDRVFFFNFQKPLPLSQLNKARLAESIEDPYARFAATSALNMVNRDMVQSTDQEVLAHYKKAANQQGRLYMSKALEKGGEAEDYIRNSLNLNLPSQIYEPR